MNLYKETKPKTNKNNNPALHWPSWNEEDGSTLANTSTKKKPKLKMKPASRNRSWSNNLVERKQAKGTKILSKHSALPRQAQPSKSWVQTKPRIKPSISLKYGLFQQPRKVQSPQNRLQSPTRLRGPNTRLRSPTRHQAGLNPQGANMRDKTGDRAVKINAKKEGAKAATKKGSSHYSVVSRSPPAPKLGMSDTMHLDIKPGKGRYVTPPR